MLSIIDLNAKLSDCDLTKTQLANELKISPSTLYRKIGNSGLGFTIGEVQQISKVLSLSADDVNRIFFSQ